MPCKHDASKMFISLSVDRELAFRLKQHAESTGVKSNAMITKIMTDYVKLQGIKLSDYYKDRADAETQAVIDSRRATWEPVKESESSKPKGKGKRNGKA